MKKKQTLGSLLALVCSTAFILVGCSSGQQATGNSNTSVTSNNGGTLVIVRQSDITSLDPHFFTDIPTMSIMNNKVYETLVTQDKDMMIKPKLATDWKQLDDLTWEFKLREGVVFHDGTPFDAQAVIQTFQRVIPRTGKPGCRQ